MKKIILIHNIITPYITLLFNKMNDNFIKEGYIFKVIFTSKTEGNRKWKIEKEINNFNFDYEILKGIHIINKSKKDYHYFHLNFNLKGILNKEKPNIVIHAGWAGISAWLSLFWCKNNNCQYILWNESTKYENSWRRTITLPFVKYLVKKSDKYISFGTRSNKYLQLLGAKENKIISFYNTVDIDYFLNESNKLNWKKDELKFKYGIKTKYILLYLGRFEKGKGIYNIINAFLDFNYYKDITLLMVGGGSEENEIKYLSRNNSNIVITGFIQQNKISELYTIADIFTLPSLEEVWGLVVNEAMCFNLPILTSYTVGASEDLVIEGKNGYIMKKNNKEEFKKGLKFILNNDLIKNNTSLEIIKEFTFDKILNKLKL